MRVRSPTVERQEPRWEVLIEVYDAAIGELRAAEGTDAHDLVARLIVRRREAVEALRRSHAQAA